MNLAPIVLFTYNRLWHTQQTVKALQKNELAGESELFIFSDEAKSEEDIPKVRQVREYLRSIKGFKKIEIIERDKNWGLAGNIIDGVTKIVNEYGKVIVLEDDLVTSPGFLRYMNEGLEMYEDREQVASIHGYIYPLKHPERLPETFFIRGADCWGWATWARAWKYFEPDGKKLLTELEAKKLTREFDFNGAYPYTRMLKRQIEGKNNSWAIRWYASVFLREMFTLYPRYSLVRNIGTDGSGMHCSATDIFEPLLVSSIKVEKIEIKECLIAKRAIENFLRYHKYLIWKDRAVNMIKNLFGRRA